MPQIPLRSEDLPQPPSARSSKTFGILGICSHLLCLLGAPFAILFGILALVKHGRAKKEHAAQPDAFAPPRAAGLITGIAALVMLVAVVPLTGIVAAIAIPALVSQQEKTKSRVMGMNLRAAEARLLQARADLEGRGIPAAEIPEAAVDALLQDPAFQAPMARNPYDTAQPGYIKGSVPPGPGCIALEPGGAWRAQRSSHRTKPGVVIRFLERRAGREHRTEKLVAFD
jgi:type II secretory pathway pseudopilin PulG